MSNRFAWVLGALVLVSIALLVACGSNYSASNDGLVLTSSQGSAVMQTFSFDLASGHVSGISNPPATAGVGSAIVLDPVGAFAYVIVTQSSSSGIAAYKVNSNGTLTTVGSAVPLNKATITIQGTSTQESLSVVPSTLAMDTSGKYLFVADRATSDSAGRSVPGAVSVFTIQSGAVTEVSGSPFIPGVAITSSQATAPDLIAVAATPTVFPALTTAGTSNSVCSSQTAPTSEYLYAADAANNMVWEFSVDTSTGALGNPGTTTTVPNYAAGSVPGGVTVDACNRFVYVSNQNSNNVSAYTMCNGSTTQSSTCPKTGDGSLVPVTGSPFSLSGGANGPGPLLVDPFGNYLYIVDTLSNQLSALHISPVSGSLTDLSPAVVTTGSQPKSIAIRSDDSWIFVANFAAATLSQYAVTPASGALTPQPAITTDNYPWGVAVK